MPAEARRTAGLAAVALGIALSACRKASPVDRTGSAASGTATTEVQRLAPTAPAPTATPPAPVRRLLTEQRRCMGTHCTISAFTDDQAAFDRGVQRALAEIDRLDGSMSTWIQSSDVSRINTAAGSGEWIPVSTDTFAVLEQSLWIARASEGAFDITVGVFKGLWKFDEDNDGSLPERKDVLARLPFVDYRGLLLDASGHRARLARKGQSITLGGIAKGYVVDRAVSELRAVGLVDFLVQAGGDLFAAGKRGDRDWKVGIEDPRAPPHDDRSADTSFALLELHDSAFNTSGDYERFVIKDGKRYHHILDPRTGYPVAHTRSVTVLASTSFMADTLDTAAFVLGAEKGMKLVASVPGAEAVIVDAHNQVHLSPGLQGRIKLLRPPTDAL